MKLNENNLSDYQMGVVQDIAREGFDCGHPMSDYDEVLACMEEDEDLCDVATDAADYYLDITADGAPSFYAEFDDEDVDNEDVDDEYDDEDTDDEDTDDEDTDDVEITEFKQVEALVNAGYASAIRLLGFGPFDEDTVRGRACHILSLDPSDANEDEEDFLEDAEIGDVVVFDQKLGQSGLNWEGVKTFMGDIAEGNVIIDGEIPVDVLQSAGLLGGEEQEDVKGRVYSFAFDFIITGDDLASDTEARDRILRDIELVDGIEIVGNPNVDPTSWSKAEYGLSEATTKRASKRSLNEKRVARSENLLKTKDVKKAVLDSFKSYFDDDENFTLAKNFDPAGTLNIQINGKRKAVVAVNVSVDEKSGTYIIDGATAKDKKNLPDLYFKGSSADEAGKDAVAAAKDVAKFAKTLEK